MHMVSLKNGMKLYAPRLRSIRQTCHTRPSSSKLHKLCTPVAAVASADGVVNPGLSRWEEFSKAVTGEWEGVTSTFSADGKPQELPQHYVPSAYRDWGVTLYDWQTVVSSRALTTTPGQLELVCRRMMPTVGCEADAVAFVEQRAGGTAGSSGAADSSVTPAMQLLACTARGCYIAAPSTLGEDASKAEVQVCLVCTGADAPKAQRLRIVHNLQRNWQTGEWGLYTVDVHNERFDTPFRGTVDLCGCGGGMSPFGSTEKVADAQLAGSWKTASCTTFVAQSGAQANKEGPDPSGHVTHLPLGVWTRSKASGKAGDVTVELGVVVAEGEMRWARCEYKGGVLQHGGLGTQKRT